jgi:hypothetical protein
VNCVTHPYVGRRPNLGLSCNCQVLYIGHVDENSSGNSKVTYMSDLFDG